MFFHLDRRDLDYIVEVLNQKPRPNLYAEPLIRLIERLKGCGGNLKKMMDGDPELAEAVAEVCVTRWMPSTNRGAYLVLQPVWAHILKRELTPERVDRMRPERYAALLFHVGTLNSEWDKLAGPCARCKRYYLKKRASQKVYCSRRCGNAATAVVRTRERLDKEHADKLRRSQAAMQKWTTTRTNGDWKAFVSKREPDISPEIPNPSSEQGRIESAHERQVKAMSLVPCGKVWWMDFHLSRPAHSGNDRDDFDHAGTRSSREAKTSLEGRHGGHSQAAATPAVVICSQRMARNKKDGMVPPFTRHCQDQHGSPVACARQGVVGRH